MNWLTQLESHITLATVLGIAVFVLRKHKIWVRLTDQMNSLWREYCTKHDIRFEKLDNGK